MNILFLIRHLIFLPETIKLLLEQGYNDAHDEFNEYRNQLMKTAEEQVNESSPE